MIKDDQIGYDKMSLEIKELRERTKMTQQEYADCYGIPVSTLRKWEQGETTPAPYIVRLLARQIPGDTEAMQRIECSDGTVFYYDRIQYTLADSLGNRIIIHEDLSDVKPQNLPLYVRDLFDTFYEIQEKFNRDCQLDKKENIIWS